VTGLSNQAKGLLITGFGVLAVTPDGLLTRLISTDPWTLLFWRGVLSSLGLNLILLLIYRGRFFAAYRDIGSAGLLVSLVFGVGTVAFIYALTHTTVANTLFLASTSPLFAALIGWGLLRDPVPPRTWIAIAVALGGVSIIVSGGLSTGALMGNLAGLGAAVSLAVSFSLVRHQEARDMLPAIGLGGLVTAVIVLPLAAPASLTEHDVIYLMLMGLVVLPVSFGLMFVGPRYIPAAEVSLMLLLEAILGPLWVWLVLDEHPGNRTLIGGAIVIATLAVNAAWALAFPPKQAAGSIGAGQ